MGEIKSAFDKAMERAEGMGKLSPEEMKKRKEEDYVPVGRAIADRYLEQGHEQLFKEEVDKHTGDERGIVTKAAQLRLVEAVSLTGYEKTERALNGLLTVVGDAGEEIIGAKVDDIARLLEEFGRGLTVKYEDEKEQIEKSDRELLHQLRISGDAVGPMNMAASETWGKIYLEFSVPYSEQLEALKSELITLLDKVE
jgi:hypothetical protein